VSAQTLVQHLLNALSIGSIYALLALGLAMVYSVLQLLNFAYGEIVTVTAYTIVGMNALGLPFLAAAPFGIAAGVVMALATEFVAFRPFRRAPRHTVVFSSFAVSLLTQAIIRNVVSPRPQGIRVPRWFDRVLRFGGLRFPVLSLITIAIAGVAMIALTLWLQRSRQGLAIRAAAEDFDATRLMGARAGGLIRLAFAISGLLAGIAGVLWIARTGSASPDMGFVPLLQAFVAVVLGGMGNLRGAVIGGFAVAFVEVALQIFLPASLVPYVQSFTLLAVIVVLYFRPHGFARKLEARVA